MKKALIFILVTTLFWSCRTVRPVNNLIIGDTEMLTGVLVKDTHTGEILFEHNSKKKFVPASNTKILTLYSSLANLGDSLQAFRYFWGNDTLYLKGTGDPTLFHPEFPESPALKILKKAKVIVISNENNHQKRYGSGWAWNDYNDYYQVELSSIPVFGNAVTVSTKNNNLNVSPRFFGQLKQDSLIKQDEIVRDEFSNDFRYNLKQNFKDDYQQIIPFITGIDLVAKLMEDTLKVPVYVGSLPENVSWSVVSSQPVDTVLRKMMQQSDNFLAEQLLILSGEKNSGIVSLRNSISAMSTQIFSEEMGSYRWVDGSGLSRYNLFSPFQMVEVLNRLYAEVPEERLFSLLSIGGKAGTLRNKYKPENPNDTAYVFAKTGSMGGVYNESGFLISKSGRLLTYSVLKNNFTGTVSENGIATMNLVKQIRERF